MRKKELKQAVEALSGRLGDCELRVSHLQDGIRAFLKAEHAGEMGNRDKAIEHLEALMGVRPDKPNRPRPSS